MSDDPIKGFSEAFVRGKMTPLDESIMGQLSLIYHQMRSLSEIMKDKDSVQEAMEYIEYEMARLADKYSWWSKS